MNKNLLLIFLSVCTFGIQGMAQSSNCQKRCGAFHNDWTPSYGADQVPYDKLTHIFHAFITPLANGSLQVDATYLDPALITKAHASGVKVFIAVGGGGSVPDTNFRTIAASPNLRAVFADSIVAFCLKYGYDGIDIDWESSSSPFSTQIAANMTLLISTIRAKFNSSPAPAPTWGISMDIPQSSYWAQNFPYDSLTKYVDFYNLMMYDDVGGWGTHFGHNSPIYVGTNPFDNVCMQTSIDYILTTRNVPAEKINAGIPFYGYIFPSSSQLYQLCPSSSCTPVSYQLLTDIEPLIGNGWTRYWDSASLVPYLLKDSPPGAITYDDSISVGLKTNYALSTRQLGGMMIYDLESGYSSTGRQPYIEGVYNAMQSICSPLLGIANGQLNNNALFDIYPNPSSASFTIQCDTKASDVAQFQLLDYTGRLIQTESFTTNTSLNFGEELTPGLYICRVSYIGGTFTKTLIKK